MARPRADAIHPAARDDVPPGGSASTVDWPTRDADVAAWARDALGLPGIVDAHVHELPDRLQAAVWSFFDRLDAPPWPIAYRDPDAAARRAQLRRLGVVAHTGLAYAHRDGMVDWLNEHTLAVAGAAPQVIATFTLFPGEHAAAQVARAIAAGGRVAKVHVQVGRFHLSDPSLTEAWHLLEAHRVPVVLHSGAVYGVAGGEEYCGIGPVRGLLERHPDLQVVLAHVGLPDGAEALALAEQAPTVRVDTAMALLDEPYLPGTEQVLAPLRDRIAAMWPRVLFGSDFPSIPHPYVTQVRGLAQLGLGTPELRAVLHDNAAALLGIGGPVTGPGSVDPPQ